MADSFLERIEIAPIIVGLIVYVVILICANSIFNFYSDQAIISILIGCILMGFMIKGDYINAVIAGVIVGIISILLFLMIFPISNALMEFSTDNSLYIEMIIIATIITPIAKFIKKIMFNNSNNNYNVSSNNNVTSNQKDTQKPEKTTDNKIICPKCGKKLDKTQTFCAKCGTKIKK